MEAFDIYLLLMKLKDKNPKLKEMLDEPDGRYENCLKFFKMNTGSIESKFQDQLIVIHFPIQPICKFISKNTRK